MSRLLGKKADGGASWVPLKSTDLNRPLPVEGNPYRVMVRIENIPRFPAGEYVYIVANVPSRPLLRVRPS